MYTIKYLSRHFLITFKEKFETYENAAKAINKIWNTLKEEQKDTCEIKENSIKAKLNETRSDLTLFKNNEIISRTISKSGNPIYKFHIFIDDETSEKENEITKELSLIWAKHNDRSLNIKTIEITINHNGKLNKFETNIPNNITNTKRYIENHLEKNPDTKLISWEKIKTDISVPPLETMYLL